MKNVLVVDDEPDILRLISENLLIRGFKVMEAKNGKEALNQLHFSLPSLMVLDIKLPDFSGWELLKQIKMDPLITNVFPVLVMTASITDANVKLVTYPNVVDVLIKPFNVTNLVKVVNTVLNS